MSAVAERRERERAERRDRILDAAQEVFWREGLEAAKMGDIAEAAELGKGTLYLYFRDKDHLALGIATRHQGRLIEQYDRLLEREAEMSGLELLRKLLAAYADQMQQPLGHLRMAMTHWAAGAPFDAETQGCQTARDNILRIFGTLCGAVEKAQAEGELPGDQPPKRLTLFLLGSVNGALLMQLKMNCLPGLESVHQHIMGTTEHIELLLEACRHLASPPPSHRRAHRAQDHDDP